MFGLIFEVVFIVIFEVAFGSVFAQYFAHLLVTLAGGMNVSHRDGEEGKVAEERCEVKIDGRVGEYKHSIRAVVEVFTEFHCELFVKIHLVLKGAQTAVAWDANHAFADDVAIINLIFVVNADVNFYVGIEHLILLHCAEELVVEFKIMFGESLGNSGERDAI